MGGGYIKPNVSLSIDTNSVYYNLDANGHEYVDLGLPSGTLWATCNVGAKKPSDYGKYFQWGDTSGYTAAQVGKDKQFTEADYKWNSEEEATKYIYYGEALDLEDDSAHINMGGVWHMPTPTQLRELLNETTITWTTSDGVSGMTFTSSNGKSIFIPAAGMAWNGSIDDNGSGGYVWSSMLSNFNDSGGQNLQVSSWGVTLIDDDGEDSRYYGFSVRGVIG